MLTSFLMSSNDYGLVTEGAWEGREEEVAADDGRNEIGRMLGLPEGILYVGRCWVGQIFGDAGPLFFLEAGCLGALSVNADRLG